MAWQRLAIGSLTVALTACGARPPAATPSPGPDPIDLPASALPTDGPTAATTADWIIGALNGGAAITEAEVTARFDATFLAQVSAATVLDGLASLRANGPYREAKREVASERVAKVWLEAEGTVMRIDVGMSASPRKIIGLLFQPDSLEPPAPSLDVIVARAQADGSEVDLGIHEIIGGRCTPRFGTPGRPPLAIGSTFKLWVLAAVEAKLRASGGRFTWDTPLAIRAAAKSLPSGVMQDLPDGHQATLREFATQMIAISDNTATDHLIDFAGREQVEAQLKATGHAKPARNVPFLTTRELFVLKLTYDDAERAAYRAASVAGKRALLAKTVARSIDLDQAYFEWTGPRDLDLEWFATPDDLCGVWAALGRAGEWKPTSEILQIVSRNPGLAVDAARWPFVGFKGGSEPGVVALSVLLQHASGRWFTMTLTANNPSKLLGEGALAHGASRALELLDAELSAGATP